MSTHTHDRANRTRAARAPVRRAPRRPAPEPDEVLLALRRLALLAAVALLVALMASAFAGILVCVVGLAVLAAHAATHPHHT
ncbi:MAG TPA: hypothetical protein VFG31_00825 [Conexibacter sp.]|nr:hypothetical protein [Conexibacter sp.]